MNINQLRYVQAVHEEGSFSKASIRCNVTQPTLSNGIASLESEIGGKLFDRNTRKSELSVFGHQILPLIEGVLHAQQELHAGIRSYYQPERKMVRVGLSPLVDARLVKNCVEPFISQHPQVDVFYKECFLGDLHLRLLKQTIDLMIRPLTSTPIKSEKIVPSPLYSEDVYFLPKLVEAFSIQNTQPVTIKDIQNETFILTNGGCGLSDFVNNLFSESGYELNVYAGEAVSYQVLCDWAEVGIGATILPTSKLTSEARLRAQPLLSTLGEPVRIEYCAHWLSSGAYPDHVNALHDHFKEVVPKYIEGVY